MNMAVSLRGAVDERSESMELQAYRPVNEGPRGRRPPPTPALGRALAQRARGGAAVHRLVALIAVVTACGGPAKTVARPAPDRPPAPVPTAAAPEGLRLPEHVAPTAYDLEIELDPSHNAFRGRVEIALDVKQPISSLWLNGVDLVLEEAFLTVGDRRIELVDLESPKGAEVIGFDLGETIGAGPARLTIGYGGAVRQRTGVFRQAVGADWYAYTDFEATDARRAFPCFDDPRHKVPWAITLVVKQELEAFANTPVAEVTNLDDGTKRVRFEPTRPMPSYLVAFAAGPFEIVEGAAQPVPIRAIVPRGKAGHARYALDAAPAMLTWLEDYFGTPVPYKKIDFISVPEFAGAMENPGLITVGARILLVDPKHGSLEQKRLLAMVIAHELAHLWFGDYVTLSWWNDLWLNEGFATWMADKVVKTWKPEWHWELEAVGSKIEAMDVDSSPDSKPIRAKIESLDDIRRAFGPITYKKGGAVLAMFEAWIGEDEFRDGIRAYIKRHADGTAEASDLLDALADASGRDVATPFNTFLEQGGVPGLLARLTCDENGARVRLRQYRHRSIADKGDVGLDHAWQIPVCIRSPLGRVCTLMTGTTAVVLLSKSDCPVWIHPNANEAGYYRYSLGVRAGKGIERTGWAELNDAERLGLASNMRAGLQSGLHEVKRAVRLMAKLADDERAPVVRQVVGALRELGVAAQSTTSRTAYAAYIRELFGQRARELGLQSEPDESDDDALLRPLLVGFVGGSGEDSKLRARARKLAKAWLKDSSAVDSELANLVVSLAATEGDATMFDAFADALESEKDDARREALIIGLGSFTDSKLTERALKLAFVDKRLTPRDAVTLLREALENPHTRDAAFDYLRANYAAVSKRIPKQLTPFLPFLAAGFCTEDRAEQIEALFGPAADQHAQSRRILDLALRQVRQCDTFRAHHQKGAEQFFK